MPKTPVKTCVFLQKRKLTTCFVRKRVALRTIEVIVRNGGTVVAIDC